MSIEKVIAKFRALQRGAFGAPLMTNEDIELLCAAAEDADYTKDMAELSSTAAGAIKTITAEMAQLRISLWFALRAAGGTVKISAHDLQNISLRDGRLIQGLVDVDGNHVLSAIEAPPPKEG